MIKVDPVTVFHDGEKEIQTRIGVRQDLEYWGHRAIRPFFPEQHRAFFSQLPFIILSARDANGLPWVTLLTSHEPSIDDEAINNHFISSPEETSLHFSATAIRGDALEHAFVDGAEIGLVGIELESRRRNRANGVLSNVSENSMTFDVTQSFGNCPQYISERLLKSVEIDANKINTSRHQCLTPTMKRWIEQSDTLFIASGYEKPKYIDNTENMDISYGMDASHRGGSAGFVSIVSNNKLVLPDYAGNNFFNTIGNLIKDPRVGLLFIDFDTGSLLQISGRATIDWDSQAIKKHAGAHRLINIEIDEIVQLDNVLPLRWSLPSGIPNGLEVISKVKESDDVVSFELAARSLIQGDDVSPLPTFRAGQHLPISLTINNALNDSSENKPHKIERTYSLSNSPFDHHYRISVKRENQGIASQYLHDHIQVGDVIEAQKPKGDFLVKFPTRPVVLISAGIGVTPIMSMLHSLVTMNMTSTIHVLYAARDGKNAPLLSELKDIKHAHNNVSLGVAFSQPTSNDIIDLDYDKSGRIDSSFIKENISDLSANFYICGPTKFLTTVLSSLEGLGVERHFIHFESF